jgi:hypothetical protein
MTTAPDPRAVTLAGQALHAAIADDWPSANSAVRSISQECGDRGVMTLIYGLCDTLAHRQGISQEPGTVIPRWQLDGQGPIQTADDVPPPARWAGQFIAARIALDQPACEALLEAVPDDETFSRNVSALLQCVALTLRGTAGSADSEGGTP